jgi:hypothetical protein
MERSNMNLSNAARLTSVSPATIVSKTRTTPLAKDKGQLQWQQFSATTTATPSTAATVRTGPTGDAGPGDAARVVIPITPPLCIGSGGGVRLQGGGGVTANSPPRAKTFVGDFQPCEPSPPVLLSQGVGSVHTQHHCSLAHIAATRGGVGSGGSNSSDGDTTGSILSDTPARPSMLAQGSRFDEAEDVTVRQHEHVVAVKEREGDEEVGELRGSADSLCLAPHYTAPAHGQWQEVASAAPYPSEGLNGMRGSDDLVRLSAAWRQVECQRAAQKVHDQAQERVLAALLAVGASSPTLRQARGAMAAAGR